MAMEVHTYADEMSADEIDVAPFFFSNLKPVVSQTQNAFHFFVLMVTIQNCPQHFFCKKKVGQISAMQKMKYFSSCI
jgi:hypothetical protein